MLRDTSDSRIVLAFDTSTDMLACAVARWTSLESRGAALEVLASADRLCRRQANVELVGSVREALTKAGCGMSDVDAVLVGR